MQRLKKDNEFNFISKKDIYCKKIQMNRTKFLISMILLFGVAHSFNLFNKVELNKTNGAMCMDGSNFAIYTFVPDEDKPANKLLIFFE